MRNGDPQIGLGERLAARRAEIEDVAMARVYAVADPATTGDPGYVAGLREAVGSAIDYALEGIDASEPPPVPPALLYQARYAARSGVPLDAVLRRYCAGHSLLGEFLMREAEQGGEGATSELQRALRREAALLDRLLGAVTEAYSEASQRRPRDGQERMAGQVRRLLAGELLEAHGLDYALEGWHLAAIARGPGSRAALRSLAASIGRRVLVVNGGGGEVWAWLGGRERLSAPQLLEAAQQSWPAGLVLAVGEAGEELAGWRRSHRQALAALPVAVRGGARQLHYADVALLAAALADVVLGETLREFLAPLESERDGGEATRRTLNAYMEAGSNVSATAASLGVSRKTVTVRLRTIEERLGRPVEAYGPELQTAVRLAEFSLAG